MRLKTVATVWKVSLSLLRFSISFRHQSGRAEPSGERKRSRGKDSEVTRLFFFELGAEPEARRRALRLPLRKTPRELCLSALRDPKEHTAPHRTAPCQARAREGRRETRERRREREMLETRQRAPFPSPPGLLRAPFVPRRPTHRPRPGT